MSNKGCFIGVAVFVGLCLIIAIIAGGNSSNTNSANEDSAAIVLDSVESVDVTNDNVAVTEDVDWVYTSEKDEMTDKVSTYATLKSENIVDFDFPYNGGSYMTLSVRKSPKYGTDVYIHISKGQFISNEYNGTNKVSVRFDDDKAISFTTIESSDGSSDILFISNAKKFIARAQKAHSIKIQAPFFQEGERIFTFNTSNPLQWK